jgi:hypothetical protein
VARKRGNPDWGKPDLHTAGNNGPTSFEEIVRKLRLSPADYQHSTRIKAWVQNASSASSAIPPKRRSLVRQDRSLTRGAAQLLFHFGSPIPEITFASQRCATTYASFFFPQMSSYSY